MHAVLVLIVPEAPLARRGKDAFTYFPATCLGSNDSIRFLSMNRKCIVMRYVPSMGVVRAVR